jgi:hypothetical protein
MCCHRLETKRWSKPQPKLTRRKRRPCACARLAPQIAQRFGTGATSQASFQRILFPRSQDPDVVNVVTDCNTKFYCTAAKIQLSQRSSREMHRILATPLQFMSVLFLSCRTTNAMSDLLICGVLCEVVMKSQTQPVAVARCFSLSFESM